MRISILLFATALWAGTDDSFLLRNVTVHPVSGPEVTAGFVLVRDGKIAEVGAKAPAVKGVRTIEGKGLHVYPGMIDCATQLGLSEISAVRESNDTTEIGNLNPQLRAVASVNPASEHFPVVRANGITSVITMPSGTVIGGQSALIHLDGWTWEEMAVQLYAALDLRFPVIQSASRRSGGSSSRTPQLSLAERKRNYEKQMAELREFFENARRYQSAKRAAAAGFKTDVKFEAMLPVLEGKTPVVVHAARERAIKEALAFAAKEKIRMILAEPREALALAKELKANDVAVIVPPTLSAPAQEDDPYDKTFTLPGELYKAGVKIAFGSFGNQFARNLPYQAAAAVAFGLPYEAALKALTMDAAEIWGLGSEYGSIEKGKWADLMVTDGDPLEHRTNVKYVFIKGKSVDLASKHQRLYQKYIERP